jgi:hypothetical protein
MFQESLKIITDFQESYLGGDTIKKMIYPEFYCNRNSQKLGITIPTTEQARSKYGEQLEG